MKPSNRVSRSSHWPEAPTWPIPEQLAFDPEGDRTWNVWRRENPDIPLDLGGAERCLAADLRGAKLEGRNYARRSLAGATSLRRAGLLEANLVQSGPRRSEPRRGGPPFFSAGRTWRRLASEAMTDLRRRQLSWTSADMRDRASLDFKPCKGRGRSAARLLARRIMRRGLGAGAPRLRSRVIRPAVARQGAGSTSGQAAGSPIFNVRRLTAVIAAAVTGGCCILLP